MGKSTGQTQTTQGGQTQQQQQQASSSTVNTGPWQPQQAPLEDAFNKASSLYDYNMGAGGQVYNGSTVAPWNDAQNTAYGQIQGMGDNANVPAALKQNLSTINGDYLNSNPYVDQMFGTASDAVKRQYMTGTAPQTAGAMAAAGRYGSGAYANLASGNQIQYGKTLDDLATSIYGGNYANERQLQQQAVGEAPTLAAARYIDPAARMAAGDAMQAQQQKSYDDVVARYNAQRMAPTTALNTFLGQIQGNYGQSGTNTSTGQSATNGITGGNTGTPYFTNPAASAVGGGLGLASLFSGGQNSAANGIGSLFSKGGGTTPGSGTTV